MGDKKQCFANIMEMKELDVKDPKLLKDRLEDLEHMKSNSETTQDFMEAAGAYLEREKASMSLERINKIENEIKTRRNKQMFDDIAEQASHDVVDYFRGILDGSSRSYKGAGNSISKEALGNSMRYQQVLLEVLDENGLLKVAKKGDLNLEIFEHIIDGKKVSKEAMIIAGAYRKVDNGLIKLAKESGSYKKKLRDRVVKRTYSSKKMITEGKENFAEFVTTNWNNKRGKVPDKETLHEIYAEIINGDYEKNLVREGRQANRAFSKSREIHLKDGKAEFEFNQKFSEGGVFDGVMQNIVGTSRDAAVFAKLGTNPDKGMAELTEHVTKKLAQMEGKEAQLNAIKNKGADITNLYESVVYGDKSGNSRIATTGAAARALSSMAKLGTTLFLAAPTDLAVSAINYKSISGKGWLESIATTAAATLKHIPRKNRAPVAQKMQLFYESMLGNHYERFASGDMVGGSLAKGQDLFFRLNGMAQQTTANKTASQYVLASLLGDNAGLKLAEMHPHFRNELNRYGIDDFDWSNLSRATDEVSGNKIISPDALDRAPLDLPKGFTEAQYKRDLKAKLTTFLVDNTEVSTPTPGARERNMFVQGLSPDTVAGQTMRMISQFKTFPVTMGRVMTKIALADEKTMGRTLAQSLKSADTRKDVMTRLGGAMTGLTIAGYLGRSMQQLVKGRTPPDPTNPKVFMEAFIAGGSAGLYGDFLLGEYDKRYKNLSTDILGPVLGGTFTTAAEAWSGAVHGRPKAKTALKLFMDNAPGSNLFYTRALLDYIVLNDMHESLSPGRGSRRKAALKETGQTLLWE